tara:strand:- start:503 stop:943 length:441 start_codon:yes stop_codon:yes gene_type:complete
MINLFLLILYFYFPSISYASINITPDFLLIMIIINSFYLIDSKILLLGFSIGLLKDFLTHSDYLGFLTLITLFFAYALTKIKSYKNKNIQYVYILCLMFIYFFINYFLKYSESYFFYFQFSLIQCVITIFTLFIFKIIFNERFKKN